MVTCRGDVLQGHCITHGQGVTYQLLPNWEAHYQHVQALHNQLQRACLPMYQHMTVYFRLPGWTKAKPYEARITRLRYA
jgi:hypothetical protein